MGSPRKLSQRTVHIISALRIVKDEEEISPILNAAKVAVQGMAAALKSLKPGMTESQVAAEAEYAMRQAGQTNSGRHTSAPVSAPISPMACQPQRKIEKNDLVMIRHPPHCKRLQQGRMPDGLCRKTDYGSAGGL